MNTYEQLVYLATKPMDSNLILCDKEGLKLKTSLAIQEVLKNEFLQANLSIDMRQACETKVVYQQ